MRGFYFILILTLVNGYPLLQTSEETNITPKPRIVHHNLGDNIMFAWKINSAELAISIKFPIEMNWFVLGFSTQKDNNLPDIEEMLWLRVKMSRLSAKVLYMIMIKIKFMLLIPSI